MFIVIFISSLLIYFAYSAFLNNNDNWIRPKKDWIIWGIIVFLSYGSLITFFTYYWFIYKRENRNILTIRKLSIFSLFFSIFIIQSFITRFMPEIGELIPFSLDSITVMAIGFMFGPIEAIIFGFVADFTRTLINGWTYQLIAASIFPIIGLLSGMCGRIYLKSNDLDINLSKINDKEIKQKKYEKPILNNKTINIIIFHVFFGLFIASSIFAIEYSISLNKLPVDEIFIFIFVPLLVVLTEIIYFYIFFKKPKDLSLILLIMIATVLSRIITGYIIRPYSIYFYYGSPLNMAIITRVATSSYLVPSKIIVLYFVLKSSLNSIELIYN